MISSSLRLATTGFIGSAALPALEPYLQIEQLLRDIERLLPGKPRDFALAFEPSP